MDLRLSRLTTNVLRMTTAHDVAQALALVTREAISARGLTQREASEAAGIPLTTLNRKLRGQGPFDILELARLCDTLDVSLTDLALRAERAATRSAA